MGDFKPYILKSTDRGVTWSQITGDLKERHIVWCIYEDYVNKDLLFTGTEFGVFFSLDGGGHWIQLKGGLPTIPIRDIEIQKRENDLVCASFGRGFFILDDFTPLRHVTPELLEQEATVFPVKKAWAYIPAKPWGGSQKASQGAALYTAPNPPFGAVFTYYLKDGLTTRKAKRQKEEKKIQKEGGDTFYPTWEELKLEDREESPAIILTISDEEGNVIRRLSGRTSPGIHRVSWNLCYPSTFPITMQSPGYYSGGVTGPIVLPGKYSVQLARRVEGKLESLGEPQTFEVDYLALATLPAEDKEERLAFQQKVAEIIRAVFAANIVARETEQRLMQIMRAIDVTPAIDMKYADEARALLERLRDIREMITGDPTKPRRSEPAPPSIISRLQSIAYGLISSSSKPTKTWTDGYEIAAEEFEVALEQLRTLVETDLKALEDALEEAKAPWTPGRALPKWKR